MRRARLWVWNVSLTLFWKPSAPVPVTSIMMFGKSFHGHLLFMVHRLGIKMTGWGWTSPQSTRCHPDLNFTWCGAKCHLYIFQRSLVFSHRSRSRVVLFCRICLSLDIITRSWNIFTSLVPVARLPCSTGYPLDRSGWKELSGIPFSFWACEHFSFRANLPTCGG